MNGVKPIDEYRSAGQFLIQIQAAIFFSRNLPDKFDFLSVALKQGLPQVFTGMSMVLPVPAELPGEVPRLQLASHDGKVQLTASKVRVDVYLGNDGPGSEEQNFADALDIIHRIVEVLGGLRYAISRVGCVSRYFVVDPEAAHSLASHFMKQSTPVPKEINLRLNYEESWGEVRVNNIYQFNVGDYGLSGEDSVLSGFELLRDYNNIPDSSLATDTSIVHAFIEHGLNKVRVSDWRRLGSED